MKAPRKIVDSLFVKAQARYPVATGSLMHRAVAVASGGARKKSEQAEARERVSGVAAANRAAGIPGAGLSPMERPNGVLAANAAAGVPGYEALRG